MSRSTLPSLLLLCLYSAKCTWFLQLSGGDSLALVSLSALHGWSLYLAHIKVPEPDAVLKKDVETLKASLTGLKLQRQLGKT